MAEDHSVRLRDGRTLTYREYGSVSGTPIVYCHGVPSSRAEGDLIVDVATAESLGLRIIVPDRLPKQTARGFVNCFIEATRHGTAGAVTDNGLVSRPWGFSLSEVRVPVLLWHGERDGNVPVAAGRYLASALSNCRATFYPDEAHLSVWLRRQHEILSALSQGGH